MSARIRPTKRSTFFEDVWRGLAASTKWLPCRYLYDPEGPRLFEQITWLREHYPTRCELAILLTHRDEIAALIRPSCSLLARVRRWSQAAPPSRGARPSRRCNPNRSGDFCARSRGHRPLEAAARPSSGAGRGRLYRGLLFAPDPGFRIHQFTHLARWRLRRQWVKMFGLSSVQYLVAT